MEQYIADGRNLINENITERPIESLIITGIFPEFSVQVHDGHPTGEPLAYAYLRVNEPAQKEIFKRTSAETFTGRTYDEFQKSNDIMTVKLIYYFHDNSIKLLTELKNKDPKDRMYKTYFRGVVNPTFEEQDDLYKLMAAQLPGTPEEYIAEVLTPNTTIIPLELSDPKQDGESIFLRVKLSKEDMDTIMCRANGYGRFGFANKYDYQKHTDITDVFAMILPEYTWIELKRAKRVNEKLTWFGPVHVPFKEKEKDILRDMAKKLMGKEFDEALKSADKESDNDNVSSERIQRLRRKQKIQRT